MAAAAGTSAVAYKFAGAGREISAGAVKISAVAVKISAVAYKFLVCNLLFIKPLRFMGRRACCRNRCNSIYNN
jgi:hypothetical protein